MFELHVQHYFREFSKSVRYLNNRRSYKKYVHSVMNRFQWSKADDDEFQGIKELDKSDEIPTSHDSEIYKYSSKEDKLSIEDNRWRPEIAWLVKALEPALQLYKWALPAGTENLNKPPPVNRSLSEIFASIQRSKLGIQDWSLSDLTIGLYLIYLQQASTCAVEDVKGEVVSSDAIVQDLIYHLELAKGAYKDSTAALARQCMIRETNTVKFIKNSSVLRPGYYIGIDPRKKLVILGIRGTHTVYDLITDIISSSHEEITFEGYSTHFGTAEAARWFVAHEIDTLRQCLENNKGFKLRLVGHSLGGATASLVAIMLRKKSTKELGFSPDVITAVGYASPPCVSKELAENCSDYVTNVVLQDDIIPRLSVASLTRLRNEILETDWISVLRREDWKGLIDLFTNAKQLVSGVHDVARKLTEYAKFRGQIERGEINMKNGVSVVPRINQASEYDQSEPGKPRRKVVADDLFVPGTVYYLKKNVVKARDDKQDEYFTLVRRPKGEHFTRILLSSNIISDHKCDNHYYALRDVLKGLPPPEEQVFNQINFH